MTDDIGKWLEGLGLGKYAEAFLENEIDFETLRRLGIEDLKELGLPIGPRKRLLAAIEGMDRAIADPASTFVAKSPPRTAEADRRQLTVMFCDLVGSTELSRHLDPEDLREVMRRYQDAVAGVVTRYAGHVAKYLGDGVLAYFGWPQAHEDQAERAVRAGLDAVDAVGDLKLDGGTALQARAGIATGQVVIGDLVGEAGAVSGETPNLAARLQETAQPGQVAIGETTRLLIAEAFELDSLGARPLKGFAEPVTVWRVVGARVVGSRFEAAHGAALTPLVGREHEIDLLLDRWAQAKHGEGQVVMLSGEAGIGKSRITQTLRERITEEPHIRLRYQCAPYFASTALHPFIRHLERVVGFATDDSPEIKLDKIQAVVAGSPEEVAEAVPIFAALLSVPAGDCYPALEMTPQRLREKTLEVLCDQVVALAVRDPVLIILEDAHWADPTTLEALERIIDRIQGEQVLAVITSRPDFAPPWHGYTHVTALTLNRLGGEDCASIVTNVTGGKGLPAEVLDQIVAKTDGVPLFVEELTKTVLESGILEEEGDRYKLTGPLPPLAIPSTLQDSLMARLDRLSSVKEVAQFGAAIGREFSFPLLAAVSALSELELTDALSELVEAELIFERGTPPNARYIFKHALVQEIAYESLLKVRRQTLHQQIAAALERQHPGIAETQPEILAHHYTRAGRTESALPYWQRAGERASKRGADLEAVAHFGNALKLVDTLPESSQRLDQELDLYIALGPALMNSKGTASIEVQRAYSRAKELAERARRRAQEFTALWGLWLHHMVGGHLDVAHSLAQQALTLAEQIGDRDCLLQAHHANWSTNMQVGDLAKTLHHAERGSALYDVERHKLHAFTYGGHDPGVCAASDGALVLWLLGYPDQARKRVAEAIRIAGLLSHAHSTAHAYCYAGIVHLLRREPREALIWSEKLSAHSEESDLELWAANAKVLCGWSLAELGKTAEGLAGFREGINQRSAAGATPRQSLYLVSLALAYCDIGAIEEADWAIGQAFKLGERFSDPYVHLAHGTILLAKPAPDFSKAEESLTTAIGLARERSARSWELRSATNLARFWHDHGRAAKARDLLAPVYDWFTEGFDTPDLKEAKALLDKL